MTKIEVVGKLLLISGECWERKLQQIPDKSMSEHFYFKSCARSRT